MIINADKGDVKVLGDIQEFKTSIDPKNLEFITTLLSSNLYSNPEQSFIREIVSNAWDSHVEAGTTDTPVIIRYKWGNNSSWEITIRDFGTGISPERFKNIFCNIGSSTKRESNEFIGGFGLGRFSSLACSNTVYITSYYNGIEYLYIMVKSGNTITTNLVMQKPTEEKNGVEITIKNIPNIHPYKRALKYIVFFPNIYVDGIGTDINDIKIKKFNNFAVASQSIELKLLLGNVLYPCDTTLISQESKDFIYSIQYTGIVLKFNIGELNITPNRESIIYTEDTINKINDKVKAAESELENIISDKFKGDYTDLYEYYKLFFTIYFNPIDNNYSTTYRNNIGGYPVTIDIRNTTFKGSTVLREYKSIINTFFHLQLPNLKGLFKDNRYYSNKFPYSLTDRTLMTQNNIISLINCPKFSAIAKEWIKDKYSEYTIIDNISKDNFKWYLENNIGDLKTCKDKNIIIDYFYDYFISKVKPIDLSTDAEFLKYKEEAKADKTSRVKVTNPIIYVSNYHNYDYKERREFKDIDSCINYIKGMKRGIILGNIKDSDTWINIAEARKLVYIRARKDVLEAIYNIHPTFIVDREWLLNDDPIIVKLHTILEEFNDTYYIPSRQSRCEMLNTIPSPLLEDIYSMLSFYYRYSNNSTYIAIAKACKKIDPYTQVLCRKLKEYIAKYNNVKKKVGIYADVEDSLEGILITAAIIKSKSYRVSTKMYNKVKNNKLLRVLCRK